MPTVNELLPQVLQLTEQERAELASSLIRSLDPPDECRDETGESLERELLRRIESVRSGTARLLDMDEAMAILYEAHERRVNEGRE